MLSMFRDFVKNEEGATAIEYGLIAALISVAAIAGFTLVGSKLSGMMTGVGEKLVVPAAGG
jgi:pilus assembly protein Flp/PilA